MNDLTERRAIIKAVLHYLGCTEWRDRPGAQASDPDNTVLDRRAVLVKWVSAEQCPDCSLTGPPLRRKQPHMGQCGTCGRHP